MELATIQPVLDWVSQHREWAGLMIFAVAAGESLALVGMVIPGVAIMLGVGTLIGLGALDLYSALIWAALGAIAGDGISYWLGKHYNQQLKHMWPLTRYPELITRGEVFFLKHGGKSVVFGRFFGPIRAIVPAIAGILGMSPLRFYLANIISALAWAPLVILPGVVFGASLTLATEVASRLVILLLSLAFVAWLIYLLLRGSARLLRPHMQVQFSRAYQWSSRHPHVGPVINALIAPGKPRPVKTLATYSAIVVTAVGLLVSLILLQQKDLLVYGKFAPAATTKIDLQHWQTVSWPEVNILNPKSRQYTRHGITLQWADSSQDLHRKLGADNWQPALELSWQSILMILNPNALITELPITLHVHNNYVPTLVWSKKAEDEILYVIRLWPSVYRTQTGEPIWIGNITHSSINTSVPLLRFLRTEEIKLSPAEILFTLPKTKTQASIPQGGSQEVLFLD